MPMAVKGSKSKPEAEFKMAAVCFQKTEVAISRPRIEMSGRNLVC